MACVNCGCDPDIPAKGRLINRAAWLGSQIVQMRERIPELEKLARKTPPKTLKSEWEKVQKAKEQLPIARQQLADMVTEQESIKPLIGWR